MSDIVNRLKDGADRFLKWVYKNPYDGPPVISTPSRPDNIDALLIEAAGKISALYDEVRMLHGELDCYEEEAIDAERDHANARNKALEEAAQSIEKLWLKETSISQQAALDADKYNAALWDAQVAIRKLKVASNA